jgi:hypothetical protein
MAQSLPLNSTVFYLNIYNLWVELGEPTDQPDPAFSYMSSTSKMKLVFAETGLQTKFG